MTNEQANNESLYSVKSNNQRLKFLEEYDREKQTKKRLIKDSTEKNLHVKFDSDEEGDNQPKKFVEKKIQLFDDDNELVDTEEHFSEKKIPKKKKKLQELQARLTTTNDPRFQFSEQFLEEEVSFEEEKKKSLAILDQIAYAKPLVSTPKPKTKMVRFDPSKTEHKIYEIESDIKSNGDYLSTNIEQTKSKEPAPVVDPKRIYEFDESKLKSMFDKSTPSNDNGHFQFQFFNNQEPTNQPVPQVYSAPKPIANGKSKVFIGQPDDTSSDEDEHDESSIPKQTEIKNETFFFFDIDDRLKDGLESFVRTEDVNELERTWPTKRKEIGEALRTKHRKALQRKDKHRVFNHRRRQNQYTSSRPISKSDVE